MDLWIYNPMRSLEKFNLVVLWTTLGNCVNMQISAAITETSIFVNILATIKKVGAFVRRVPILPKSGPKRPDYMHCIFSEIVATLCFHGKKICIMNVHICVCK